MQLINGVVENLLHQCRQQLAVALERAARHTRADCRSVHSASIELEYVRPITFNRVLLQEYIPLGQRVERFHIEVMAEDGTWRTIAEETTIGYKRNVLTKKVTTRRVRIVIDESRACIVLNRIGIFLDDILEDYPLK